MRNPCVLLLDGALFEGENSSAAVNYRTCSGRLARKQEGGYGIVVKSNTIEGQYVTLIYTNEEHPQG